MTLQSLVFSDLLFLIKDTAMLDPSQAVTDINTP